jgi:transcriptional regulator with XRE-family HTH domain
VNRYVLIGLLDKLRWKQTDLAHRTGIAQSRLSTVFSGFVPPLPMQISIAEALGVAVRALFPSIDSDGLRQIAKES